MSDASPEMKITFCYNKQTSPEAPKVILVSLPGKELPLAQDGVPVQVEMPPPPPVQNGMINLVFHKDFSTLDLYFDGIDMWVPIMAVDGTLSVLAPVEMNEIIRFVICPTTSGYKPGSVALMINNENDTGDPGLGVIIVGTSGLVDTSNPL